MAVTNLATAFGGSVYNKTYLEIIRPSKAETRTGQEIIEDLSNKLEKLGEEE